MQFKYLIPLVILATACTPAPVERPSAPTVAKRVAPYHPNPGEQARLLATLQRLAPAADPQVLSMALQSRQCAMQNGRVANRAHRLAVIDFSRPSSQKRMWVFDLGSQRLLYDEFVAHGEGSGDNMATKFSNIDNSHQTSLGLFTTAETYYGANGYSLRMDGLEPGINDNARSRAIVIHGADYVNPNLIPTQGRIGRSWGCPAVRRDIAPQLIDTIKEGNLLFAYYPDPQFVKNSGYLGCGGAAVADIGPGFNAGNASVTTNASPSP